MKKKTKQALKKKKIGDLKRNYNNNSDTYYEICKNYSKYNHLYVLSLFLTRTH